MTNLSLLFKSISSLHSTHEDTPTITPSYIFPFPSAYTGQDEVIRNLQGFEQAGLSSPTGTGKSAVIMALTRDTPSIIIEPRKFLQHQISQYFNDYVLYGRSEYPCKYAKNAAGAPCNRKSECDLVNVPVTCQNAKGMPNTSICPNSPCKTFSTRQLGAGDFGVTVVLDSKAMEVYQQRKQRFPDWFVKSFDVRCY